MPWLDCVRCKKIRDDLAARCLEAQSRRNGSHWLQNQHTKSNKDQPLHDELNNVDIEPLVDTLVQKKAQLRQLEPTRTSTVNLPRIPSFYKPQKYFGGFYLEKFQFKFQLKNVLFLYFISNR